jgi:hypothetical protein
MTLAAKRILFWTPRVLAIAFAVFLALFALDAFGEGYTGWRLLLALAMHLVPAGIVAAVLALAWRWEWLRRSSPVSPKTPEPNKVMLPGSGVLPAP